MEYHGIRLSARTRNPEPSWPSVIATTVRLWLERHPPLGRKGTRRRRNAGLLIAAVCVVALGAGVAGAALSSRTTSASSASSVPATVPQDAPAGPGAGALETVAATRAAAARWIAGQVASSAIVACDPAMCAALEADGITASSLLVLGTSAADPLGSDVVVATAAVRNQFGARLASVYAPSVIASFGSGAGRIDVRAVAPDGAAAYESTLAADRSSRISAGAQLLRNPGISVTAAAGKALRAGDVDPRLLVLLAALAVQQPVRVSAFGDPSPGASTAVPLRSATIAPLHPGAKAKSVLKSMLSFVETQQQPYEPLRASLIGTSALTVEYAAPSPLGLLSGP
jgi:hypothetical protein